MNRFALIYISAKSSFEISLSCRTASGLHVYSSGDGNLQPCTCIPTGGRREYNLHFYTSGGGKGYSAVLLLMEMHNTARPYYRVWKLERNSPCTSIFLVAAEMDTTCMSILLTVEMVTPCMAILLAVEMVTPCI
jgi:hypothetical protein